MNACSTIHVVDAAARRRRKGALSDPHADQEHYHEQPDEHGRADEAQFLTDDREDEVVVRLRQVAPLRVRLPQALAEQPTVGEGVLGLDGLVVQPLRVEVGIHEGLDPVRAVARGQTEDHRRRDGGDGDRGDRAGAEPAEPQHRHQDDADRDHGAEIALEHDERHDRHAHHGQRFECGVHVGTRRLVVGDQMRTPEHQRDLRELRWLKGDSADDEPATGAHLLDTDSGNEDEDEEHPGHSEEPRRPRAQRPGADAHDGDEGDGSDGRIHRLGKEPRIGRSGGHERLDARRRQHHGQPDRHQQGCHAEDYVEVEQRSRKPHTEPSSRHRTGLPGSRCRLRLVAAGGTGDVPRTGSSPISRRIHLRLRSHASMLS